MKKGSLRSARLAVAVTQPARTLGTHVIADLFGCPFALLDDEAYVRESIVDAAKASGLTIIDVKTHKFSPQGVTGVVVLAESHLSIHTWPEHGFAAVDVFTCGSADPKVACDMLAKRFSSSRCDVQRVARGKI